MLAEMGDLGFGGYNENYSEYERQPSIKLMSEKKAVIKPENDEAVQISEADYKTLQENINKGGERDRAYT